MATTIIERDSSSSAAGAFLIFILFAVMVGGVVWFAYTHGIVGNTTVIENHKTVLVPTPSPTPSPGPNNK